MSSNDYTYGEADEVRKRLMSEPNVTLSDVVGALANAMQRIAYLEHADQLRMKNAQNPLAPSNSQFGTH